MKKRDKTPYLATFSPEMTLFELVESSPSLLGVLSRLNVRLPFGDVTVAEMCQREGMDVALFLTICSMHADPSFRPSADLLTTDMLAGVTAYLRASHRYYAEYTLPHTETHLDRILAHCDTLSQSALHSFYNNYSRYIVAHFEEEERNIFALSENPDSVTEADCSIFDMPHAEIDDCSNDIASLVFKNLPESAPTPLRCALLDHIYALRDDLRRHSDIEAYLLRPLVEKLIAQKR
jgi:regulator of cell morphogenesis and NO signaling